MLDPARADHDCGDGRLREQPRDRQRRRADAAPARLLREAVEPGEGLVGEEVLVRPRARAQPRARLGRLAAAVLAAQEAAGKWAERRVAPVEGCAQLEHFVLV